MRVELIVTDKGLTLLESMVALVILGLVVVGYLELLGGTVRTSRNSVMWTEAVTYAEQGMEMAKLDAPRMLLAGSESLDAGFGRHVTLRPWSAGIQLVTVTISMPDGGEFALRRLVEMP
jgi:prepilin-type N-terminal cleavage/methylation domain-containing protein